VSEELVNYLPIPHLRVRTSNQPSLFKQKVALVVLTGESKLVVVLQQTLSFLDYQVRHLCWRHQVGTLFPSRFDPNSIPADGMEQL